MNSKLVVSLAFFFSLSPLGAQDAQPVPIPLANAGFESVKENKIEGWQVYAWGRPVDGIAVEASSGAVDGQNCVSIAAVDKGLAGIISPVIKLDAKNRIYRLKFWVKRSADYAGNQPWVFFSFHNGAKFLATADVKLKLSKQNEWEEQTALLFDDEVPAGATDARLNLTSSGTGGSGKLFFDKISLESGTEESVFGAAPRSPFTLKSDALGNWLSSGEAITFKVKGGSVPAAMKELRGTVRTSRGEKIAEVAVSREDFISGGWKYTPANPGYYEVRFEYFRTGVDKPLVIQESLKKTSSKGVSKVFPREVYAFVSASPSRPMKERSPRFGFSDQLEQENFLALADKVGFRFARVHAIPWGAQFTDTTWAMEPSKGDYRFERFDAHMAELRKFGFDPIGNVLYTPRWASSHPEDTNVYICAYGYSAYAPKNMDDLSDFLKVMVRRYGGEIKTWEVWNEPHLPGGSVFWLDTPENFVKLLKTGYTTIKSVQPESEIWIGGLGGRRYLPFYKTIMGLGAGQFFDKLALHGSWTTPTAFNAINKTYGVAEKPWVSSEHHTILMNATVDIPTEEALAKRMMIDYMNHLKHGAEKLASFEMHNLDEIETLPFCAKEGIFTHSSGLFRSRPNVEPRLAACVAHHFFSALGTATRYAGEYALGKGQRFVSFDNDGALLLVLWSEGDSAPVDGALAPILKTAKVSDWEGKSIPSSGFIVESGKFYFIAAPKTELALKTSENILVSEKEQKLSDYPIPVGKGFAGALLDNEGNFKTRNLPWVDQGWLFQGKDRPSEFDAKFAIGSGETGIGLVVEVKDRSFVQNETTGRYWNGDSLQFAIDTFGQSVPQDQVQFQVALEKSTPVVFKEMNPYIGGDIPQKWTPSMQVAKYAKAWIEPTDGGMLYKVHIDYTELYPFAMNAKDTLRFAILVNNNNGSGRLGWLEWGGGIGKDREPAQYGKINWE